MLDLFETPWEDLDPDALRAFLKTAGEEGVTWEAKADDKRGRLAPRARNTSDVDAIAATTAYRQLIERLRRRIRESQARGARALNTELVLLYWSIGQTSWA